MIRFGLALCLAGWLGRSEGKSAAGTTDCRAIQCRINRSERVNS